MQQIILDKSNYLPIRTINYDIGALLLYVLTLNNVPFDRSFSTDVFSIALLQNVDIQAIHYNSCFQILIDDFYSKANTTITRALQQNNLVEQGRYELLGVNIYDAIYKKPFIISRYFVMYRKDNNPNVLYGDFII